MTANIDSSGAPADSSQRDSSNSTIVAQLLRQEGLPAADDEIGELGDAYPIIRGPVTALYSERVEELLWRRHP